MEHFKYGMIETNKNKIKNNLQSLAITQNLFLEHVSHFFPIISTDSFKKLLFQSHQHDLETKRRLNGNEILYYSDLNYYWSRT